MMNRLYAVICFLLLSQIGLSQDCNPVPPDGLDCSTAIHLCGAELDGYESILPDENLGNNPDDQLCFNSGNDGGMVNNINWFSFIACSNYVEFTITPDNCTVSNALVGLQAGIYTDCSFEQNMVCIVECFDNATTVAAIGFIPNEKYYLFVDGCNGSVCDYRIDVEAGVDTDPITFEMENNQAPQISGDPFPCLSSVVNYTYSVPSCMVVGECTDFDPYELGLACYEWTIPASASIVGDQHGPEIEISFGDTGTFAISVELILDPYLESCGGGSGICGTIPVLPVVVNLPDYEVLDPIYFCPGDSVHFCGQYYTTPQEIVCENPLNGCAAQKQVIAYKEEVVENLGVLPVCPGECVEVNGMQFCNPNVYEIPKNFCDTFTRFEIEILDFTLDISGLEEINCDKPQLQLEASASFDGASFDFQWKNDVGDVIATGPLALILQGGDYTVEGIATKNGVECIEIVEFTIDEDSDLPSFSLDAEDINCNNSQVQIQFESFSNIISYDWTGPDSFTSDLAEPVINQAGQYQLTVTSANGCTVSQIINITEDLTVPVITFEDPTLTCMNPSIMLTTDANINIFEYQWQAPDGSFSNAAQPTIDQVGQYQITAVGENGCTEDFVVNVSGDFDLPQADIVSGEINCYTPELNLSFETSYTIINQTWTDPDGNTFNSSDLDIQTGGQYTLAIEADNGCVSIFDVNINEDQEAPTMALGEDPLWNCNTETLTLQALVETGSFDLSWTTADGSIQSGSNSNSVVISDPGTYIFEVLDPNNGCSSIDSSNVVVNSNFPREVVISTFDPQCYGAYSGVIQIDEIIGGQPPFNVIVNGTSIGSDMVMSDHNAGLYIIEVLDANECSIVSETELFNPLEIILDAEDLVQVNYGESTNIELGYNIPDVEVMDISWVNENNEVIGSGKTLVYQPIKSETVTAHFTSIDGCELSEEVRVNLRKDIDVFAPTAFTPNNDGINDKFTLFGRSDIALIRTMNIFDRWGNTVYEGIDLQLNDEDSGWDGKFGHKEMMTGVYVYIAMVELLDGTEFQFKGSITLIR